MILPLYVLSPVILLSHLPFPSLQGTIVYLFTFFIVFIFLAPSFTALSFPSTTNFSHSIHLYYIILLINGCMFKSDGVNERESSSILGRPKLTEVVSFFSGSTALFCDDCLVPLTVWVFLHLCFIGPPTFFLNLSWASASEPLEDGWKKRLSHLFVDEIDSEVERSHNGMRYMYGSKP